MTTQRRCWTTVLFLLVAFIAVYFLFFFLQESTLHALPYGFKKFDLADPLPSCGRWREHMPSARDRDTYQLYIKARRLWRSKIGWQLTREETTRILTDVGKAADMGDWGARALMAHFLLHGLGALESNHVLDANPEKAVEIQRMAVKAGQPWGFYDLGVAYEHGYGGVPYDDDLAWAYYLRAAQLGSPEAQMALASAYRQSGRPDDEATMLNCAYRQGHGPAAYALGMKAEVSNRFKDAIDFYQEGVKFGSVDCAAALWLLFDEGHWINANDAEKEALKLLGIHFDPERARRYRTISDALKINPDLKLTRLDSVLPLPPAQLPAWSGIDDAVEPESNGPPKY